MRSIVSKKPSKAPPSVPQHRQCPSCHGGRGGVGKEKWWTRKSGTTVKRCYKCNVCGFEWTVVVKTVKQINAIEWQEIEIDHADIDLDTR